jgi:stage II sporulation protein R
LKNWTTVILILTLIVSAVLILPVHAATGVYDSVIRLHVLANSDSEEDQALKLQVRDAVLAYTGELMRGVSSKEKAEEILGQNLEQIRAVAAQVLGEQGASSAVEVTLTKEEYPRRAYEQAALPAGEYLSLRVMIGEAEGQNWWCVLFPQMCLSASAVERETSCLAAGLSEGQYRFITGSDGTGYRVRFKLVEMVESMFG